jgi:hypothetical protein
MNRLAEEMSAAQEQALRCAEIRREFATAAFRSTMEPAKAGMTRRRRAPRLNSATDLRLSYRGVGVNEPSPT